MYREWIVGRKERCVVVDVDHLDSDDRSAELVPCAGIIGTDLEPVEVLDLSVQRHGRLHYAGPRRIDNERRLGVAGGDFVEDFTERTAVCVTSFDLKMHNKVKDLSELLQ